MPCTFLTFVICFLFYAYTVSNTLWKSQRFQIYLQNGQICWEVQVPQLKELFLVNQYIRNKCFRTNFVLDQKLCYPGQKYIYIRKYMCYNNQIFWSLITIELLMPLLYLLQFKIIIHTSFSFFCMKNWICLSLFIFIFQKKQLLYIIYSSQEPKRLAAYTQRDVKQKSIYLLTLNKYFNFWSERKNKLLDS